MIASERTVRRAIAGAEQGTGSGNRLELHHYDVGAVRRNVGNEIPLAVAIAFDGLQRGVGDTVRVCPVRREGGIRRSNGENSSEVIT